MRLVFLAACTAGMFACTEASTVTAPLQAPLSPLGAVLVNETLPITEVVTNPCNGESVVMSGTQHIIVSESNNNSGSFTMRQHLTGVGASGLNYRSQFAVTERFKLDPNSATVLYSSAAGSVITTGQSAISNQDWHETQTFRMVIPAGGGTPSVERVSSSQKCRGKPVA